MFGNECVTIPSAETGGNLEQNNDQEEDKTVSLLTERVLLKSLSILEKNVCQCIVMGAIMHLKKVNMAFMAT